MALSLIPLASKAPKIAKYAIPVLGIIAVGGAAYVGYLYLKDDEPPKLASNPNFEPNTLTDVQARTIADRLYSAMASVGTDEDEIKEALTGLTYNEFVKVYEAFGKRQYSIAWGNVGDPITSDKHHLITWLTNELDSKDIDALKVIIPGIL